MIGIGLGAIALAGVIHVGIFLIEGPLWQSRSTWRLFGIRDAAVAEAARPWALNQGFYNLFLAVGAIGGAVTAAVAPALPACAAISAECLQQSVTSQVAAIAGIAVAAFSASCMVGAAVVLRVTGGRRSTRSALLQGALPFLGVAIVALAAATWQL